MIKDCEREKINNKRKIRGEKKKIRSREKVSRQKFQSHEILFQPQPYYLSCSTNRQQP